MKIVPCLNAKSRITFAAITHSGMALGLTSQHTMMKNSNVGWL